MRHVRLHRGVAKQIQPNTPCSIRGEKFRCCKMENLRSERVRRSSRISQRRTVPSKIGLIPQNPQDYAAWLEWCFFSVMELDAASLYVIRRHGAAGLGHVYGFAPEVCERAAEYFVQQLRHVDVTLSDGRPFLLGDHFTSADILLTTCLEGALAYDITLCDNAYPYLDRIRLRPGYKRGHEANAMPSAN